MSQNAPTGPTIPGTIPQGVGLTPPQGGVNPAQQPGQPLTPEQLAMQTRGAIPGSLAPQLRGVNLEGLPGALRQ